LSDESSSFFLLDKRIQRFIWSEGWTELRDAQEMAIPLILKGERDVIVAAATAAGKTEAAFLPILTKLLAEPDGGGLVVYISPLKALINDQFGRLDRLCELLEIPVWPWHGDVSSTPKTKFLKTPQGVLLITPESLEAMLCNRGTSVARIFSRAMYVVVDELHAFIGTERGKQLQSLMHRMEIVADRKIRRVGLSATLGDMSLAAGFLRPNGAGNVALVESKSSSAELKFRVKGYEDTSILTYEQGEPSESMVPRQIAKDLFGVLRGSNNLVFPNSRREVERYTHLLTEMCEEERVPNEFWPHHGSLSKEIRYETEAALKQKERPATAICTNTLELGIDIGAVKSVVQIGAPPSVASLRQRLGRSGRRKGEPAILRGYCIESELNEKSSLASLLRLGTVEMAAKISLLLDRWFEPPVTMGLHLSTLIQQLLSLISQNGGIHAGHAYKLLCGSEAPFNAVSADEFKTLLRHLGSSEILMQDSSGLLLHGAVGEQIANHYAFYAAFTTDEEFRLVSQGKTLGTLPLSQMLTVGQRILFAGKTWLVEEIQEREKTIYVRRAGGGTPPTFSGGGGRVHSRVRSRMRELLEGQNELTFLDPTAQRFLAEARSSYSMMELAGKVVHNLGSQSLILTWLGDSGNEALACYLRYCGLDAAPAGPGVEVMMGGRTVEQLEQALAKFAASAWPNLDELLAGAMNLEREKWDRLLPKELLGKSYASLNLDIDEAARWFRGTFV